jgi:hypothetical protein
MKLTTLQLRGLRTAVRILLIILGWATSLAAITLVGIFNGVLLPRGLGGLLPQVLGGSMWGPWILYLAMFGMSFLAAFLIENPGIAFGSFFVSFCVAGAITYLVLILPGLLGAYGSAGVLAEASIRFTFLALFPFPLIAGLVGTILGLFLADMRG